MPMEKCQCFLQIIGKRDPYREFVNQRYRCGCLRMYASSLKRERSFCYRAMLAAYCVKPINVKNSFHRSVAISFVSFLPLTLMIHFVFIYRQLLCSLICFRFFLKLGFHLKKRFQIVLLIPSVPNIGLRFHLKNCCKYLLLMLFFLSFLSNLYEGCCFSRIFTGCDTFF